MSGDQSPSKYSTEKSDSTLDIKEEPYDQECDRANQDAQNTSIEDLKTTLDNILVNNVFPTDTDMKTEKETEGCEQSTLCGEGSNSNTVLPDIKSEKGNESVCIKEEPEYDAVHHNTDIPSLTTEDQEKEQESFRKSETENESGCIKEEPNDPEYDDVHHTCIKTDDQNEEQDSFRKWTVTSSNLVPMDETGSHTTQTCSVENENTNIGTQSLSRDEDAQGIDQSSMELTSCDLHGSIAGRVKRGRQESAVGISKSKRQKQGHIARPESTIVKQECEGGDDANNSNVDNSTILKCAICSSTFPSKTLLGAHRCKAAIYLHMPRAEQLTRGHKKSAVGTSRRQRQGNVTTPGSTIVKQECENEDDVIDSDVDNSTSLKCKFCLSTFPRKILLEAHLCKAAIYFCKICSHESTRRREHTLMPLPKAEHHFHMHFHPGYFARKDPAIKEKLNPRYQFPEELQRQLTTLKYSEVNLLKDLYIGISPSGGDSQHTCGLCGATFTTAGARVQHVKAHLGHKRRTCGPSGIKCKKTTYACCQHDKLLCHMFRAHGDVVKEQSGYVFKCKFCTMQFQERTELEWHLYSHMKPDVDFAASAQENSLGQPQKDSESEAASEAQFRCTICSLESVESTITVQLYTAAKACQHLSWHWRKQLPPEIRKNPNVFNFGKDYETIRSMYLAPHKPGLIVKCKFCGKKESVEGICRHTLAWHKEYVKPPLRCMQPECKHLLFKRKPDFFGHMFMQHVSVLKRETFMFLCLICHKTFQSRGQMEWHCYVHTQ
ncbi:Cytochrome P450 3A4 [Branchiostoma belcheri]|nr:Cytochrome P450 3A4 [Branchiostoma belcheri]